MPSYQDDTAGRCLSVMKKNGGLFVLLAAVLVGAGLLLLPSRAEKESESVTPSTVETPSAETYRVVLERRIAELCARVAGAGQVSVVVTLEGGYESVYACDRKVTSAGETVTYIKIGRGEEERLVYLGERAPGIVGVGVVCSGGKDATVCREVTSLISAAFGVPINKIYVAGGP